MSESPSRSNENEDQLRDAAIYRHLLTRFTDLDVSENSPKPNESKIAKQWGLDKNRIFIRRVLRSVMPEFYDEKEREDKVPGLTLGKLVNILTSLQNYQKNEQKQDINSKRSRIITQQQKKTILRKYVHLLPEEAKRLELFVHPEANLLQQLTETVTDQVSGLSNLTTFYKQALTLYESLKLQYILSNRNSADIDKSPSLENQITDYINPRIDQYYQGISPESKEEIIKDFLIKVLTEVNRIEFQAGIRQIRSIIDECPGFVEHNLNKDLIYSFFLENLVNSIIKNSLLLDELPIHIDYVEIKKVEPLSLKLYQGDSSSGLINPYFLNDDNNENNDYAKVLEKQTAYQVKVYFYLYTPDNWQPNSQPEVSSFFQKKGTKSRLIFCEEVIGIGSPISHVITAIDRFLLEDIPILKENGYLPVTQKIFVEDKIVGNTKDNVVCSYNLVRLCKIEDVKESLDSEIKYEEIVVDHELALGEYYGFDLLEAASNSALFARLRAIQQAEIDSQIYLQQLCNRIEEKYFFKQAQEYLHFYPFSLLVMQDYLKQHILKGKILELKKDNLNLDESKKLWSLVAYEAHLKIIQTYLQEGRYRMGKKYLDIIQLHIDNQLLDDKLLICLYYLCLFRYHFYTDLKDPERPHEQRGGAIRKAEECLNEAEKILQEYLRDYAIIGEYCKTNVHPFFYYLSRIYAHRAKIYIFFPHNAQSIRSELLLIEPISLLEKARIYAARDGNPNHYAYWTVYQAWCYLILAYLGNTNQMAPEFSRTECIQWAKRLIESALNCYAEKGKKSYQQIKDNSGKQQTGNTKPNSITGNIEFYEKHGDILVQTIPLIIETEENSANLDYQLYPLLNKEKIKIPIPVLTLPMSVLIYPKENSREKVYLFGVYSSFILFGLGMIELCEDIEDNDLLKKLKMAMRRFTICAAIASEGTIDNQKIASEGTIDNQKEDYTYLERIFEVQDEEMPDDFQIRGLYPHRLTHFAVLGKVFAAACRVILWLYNPNEYPYWQEIEYLLSDLHDEKTMQHKSTHLHTEGQKRYNGHLEEQLTRIKDYLEGYHQNSQTFSNLTQIRNKIVTDVFKILRGDKV